MLRIYRYNSPYDFKEFETHLFTTLRPTFDHPNDRLYIDGLDYRISTINYIGLFNRLIDNQASYRITFGKADESWAVVSCNQSFTFIISPKLTGCVFNVKLKKSITDNITITLPNNSHGKDITSNAIVLTGEINSTYILTAIYENGEYDWLVRSRTEGYGSSVSWTEITDIPTEFPPSAHTHPDKANIAGDTFTGNVSICKNSDLGAYFGIINENANGNVLLEMIGDPAISGSERNRIIIYRPGSTDAQAETRFRGNARIASDTKLYIGGNNGIYLQVNGTINQESPMVDVVYITPSGLMKTLISNYDSLVDNSSFITKSYSDARYSLLNHNHSGIYQPVLGFTPENVANKNQNSGYAGLDSGGKIPLSLLPSTLLIYKGVWNASTNTPNLSTPDISKAGHVYNVGVAGTQFGIAFSLGDWAIYNDAGVLEKSDNSDDVTSVNGLQGAVNLDSFYSAINHNHDSRYSQLTHNHDSRYSQLTHNHDAAYAAINHTHSQYIDTSSTEQHKAGALSTTDFSVKSNDSPTMWLKNAASAIKGATQYDTVNLCIRLWNATRDMGLAIYDSDGRAVFSGALLATTIEAQHKKKIQSVTSTATFTHNCGTYDTGKITAQAASLTMAAPAATPYDLQEFLFYLKDNGTSRSISWNSAFSGVMAALPASTTAGKQMVFFFVYNTSTSKWELMNIATGV